MPKIIQGLALFTLPVFVASCSQAHAESNEPLACEAPRSQAPSCSATSNQVDTNIFVNLAKKIIPSVVNISTAKIVRSPFLQGAPDDPFRRFFEDFFNHGEANGGVPGFGLPGPHSGRGHQKLRPMPKAMSLGTGFIIDSSGLILTNNHVVADADEIKVAFTEDPGETPTDGEVVGRDAQLDVALIRVKTNRELIPLPLGDSDSLQVGEFVVAVGNPFGQGHSISHGIISAKGRNVPGLGLASYLQTDTPINPGNSGGPLVNLRGEVVGINNAILANAQGIGFAIPISTVTSVLQQLKSKGSVERGYLGALVGEISPEIADRLGLPQDIKGAFVTNVTPGGPAETAGIKPYDLITGINGKRIRSSRELVLTITAEPPGERAKVAVNRSGKEMEFSIKVAKRPADDFIAAGRQQKNNESINAGMTLVEITPESSESLSTSAKSGLYVSGIQYGGPADRAGLIRGDVIMEVDRKPVKTVQDFMAIVRDKKSYMLRVQRSDPSGAETFAVIVLDLKD